MTTAKLLWISRSRHMAGDSSISYCKVLLGLRCNKVSRPNALGSMNSTWDLLINFKIAPIGTSCSYSAVQERWDAAGICIQRYMASASTVWIPRRERSTTLLRNKPPNRAFLRDICMATLEWIKIEVWN